MDNFGRAVVEISIRISPPAIIVQLGGDVVPQHAMT